MNIYFSLPESWKLGPWASPGQPFPLQVWVIFLWLWWLLWEDMGGRAGWIAVLLWEVFLVSVLRDVQSSLTSGQCFRRPETRQETNQKYICTKPKSKRWLKQGCGHLSLPWDDWCLCVWCLFSIFNWCTSEVPGTAWICAESLTKSQPVDQLPVSPFAKKTALKGGHSRWPPPFDPTRWSLESLFIW